jgi:glycine/D-amino acid oxidase-like deaminating enzyme
MANVVVVGAGIIGVTTALSILESDPSIKLTVIADAFTPHTTSDGAAGIIMPFVMSNTPMSLQR